MVTLEEIAKATGSSMVTVSRVLNGHTRGVRRDSRDRTQNILRVAEQMGYQPNSAARSMRNRTSPHIGVLVRNASGEGQLTNPQAFGTIMGINAGLEDAGYVVTLVRLDDMQHPDTSRSRIFRERILEGMIVVSGLPAEVASAVTERFANCIWCDANTWQRQCCIHRDERRAGRLAAQAVLNTGIRRLVYFRGGIGPDGHYSACDRRSGVLEAGAAEVIEIESHREHAHTARDRVLPLLSAHTGVVVATTSHMRGLIYAAAMAGRVPGRDFAVTCCDDSNEFTIQMPELTRVAFDRFAMGEQAATMMIAQLENKAMPESVLLQDDLIEGTTHFISTSVS